MPCVRAYCNPAEAGSMTSPLDGTQLTAESIDSAPSGGGVVDGSSGCNTYSASYDDSGWLTQVTVTLTLMLLVDSRLAGRVVGAGLAPLLQPTSVSVGAATNISRPG